MKENLIPLNKYVISSFTNSEMSNSQRNKKTHAIYGDLLSSLNNAAAPGRSLH